MTCPVDLDCMYCILRYLFGEKRLPVLNDVASSRQEERNELLSMLQHLSARTFDAMFASAWPPCYLICFFIAHSFILSSKPPPQTNQIRTDPRRSRSNHPHSPSSHGWSCLGIPLRHRIRPGRQGSEHSPTGALVHYCRGGGAGVFQFEREEGRQISERSGRGREEDESR